MSAHDGACEGALSDLTYASQNLIRAGILGVCLAAMAVPAAAQDAELCLMTAERADSGEDLSTEEKTKAHEACLRALSETSSVLQKYQFQEADFAIMGTHHQY